MSAPHHLGVEFAPVGKLDADSGGAADHVIVGQHVPVGGDDHAAALAQGLWCQIGGIGLPALSRGQRFDHGDVDDRGLKLFSKFGEGAQLCLNLSARHTGVL